MQVCPMVWEIKENYKDLKFVFIKVKQGDLKNCTTWPNIKLGKVVKSEIELVLILDFP
jgi:hypothetical protein